MVFVAMYVKVKDSLDNLLSDCPNYVWNFLGLPFEDE